MNRYKTYRENEKDDLISITLLVAFNQEAYAIELLRTSQKERFSRSRETSSAQAISDGEQLQKISDLQREAGSSIFEASGLVGSISADTSDQTAKKIEYSQLSCSENDEIVELLKATAVKTETIYGESAKMILDSLQGLKCRH